MQYFRWLWQKKASLVFQTRCLFIPRLASSSKKPMAFHRDAHWKYRCCLTAAKHFFASEASERGGSGARGCWLRHFRRIPPAGLGTTGCLFVPFEGDKAPATPSPAARWLPLRPSMAPSDVGLLGGKANRREARRAGQKTGVLSGSPSVRLCSKGRRRLEISKLLRWPRSGWEKGFIQPLLGCSQWAPLLPMPGTSPIILLLSSSWETDPWSDSDGVLAL